MPRLKGLALLGFVNWPLVYLPVPDDIMVATLRKPRDHVWACAERSG